MKAAAWGTLFWIVALFAVLTGMPAPCSATVRYSLGPSSVMLHWPAHGSIFWHLYDASGERALYSSYLIQPLGASLVTVPPGHYVVKVDGIPACQPIAVTVVARRVAHVVPAVGEILLRWRGLAPTTAVLLDSTGEREIQRLYVQPNSSNYMSVGPGSYRVSAAVPGLRPSTVTVRSGGVSSAAPWIGTIAFQWRGLGSVVWYVMNPHAQRDVSGPVFGQPNSTQYVDVGAGSYALRANVIGLPHIPVTVPAFRVVKARPPVSSIVFYWNGAGTAIWRLWDADGQSDLSGPQFSPSSSRKAVDVGPGVYRLKLDGPFFPPIPVKVAPSVILRVTPAVGTLRLSWSRSPYVNWNLFRAGGLSQIGGTFLLLRGPAANIDLPPGRYSVGFQDPSSPTHNVAVGEERVSTLAF